MSRVSAASSSRGPHENLEALMARQLDDLPFAVPIVDGIELKGPTNVVAL